MTGRETSDDVDYRDVAVCLKDDPAWTLGQWTDLTDELLPDTHLIRPDQLLVRAGAEDGLDDAWKYVESFDGVSLYRRAVAHDGESRSAWGPPSGAPVMHAVNAGVAPNVVYCSQGLRAVAEETVGGFQVAPRYQGRGAEARPAKAPTGLGAADRPDRLVQVGVVDTGLGQGRYLSSWLEEFIPARFLVSAEDEDHPDLDGDRRLDSVAGHGMFVAGLIAQVEPRVRISVIRAVDRQGVVSTVDVVRAIDRLRSAVPDGRLDILNLSLGGWTYDDRAPLSLAEQLRDMDAGGTVTVAAAGNLGTERKFWPAAMPEVIGVGAVTRGGGRLAPAEYSNHGDWVNAWADGDDQVSTFFANFVSQPAPGHNASGPAKFDGWGIWSGTSFAAPQVAGNIARTMFEEGTESAHAAWDHLNEQRIRPDLTEEFGTAAVLSGDLASTATHET